ncbi:MAG TPA: hypothetical protein VIU61_11030 [Kofleriaceae bacterium]
MWNCLAGVVVIAAGCREPQPPHGQIEPGVGSVAGRSDAGASRATLDAAHIESGQPDASPPATLDAALAQLRAEGFIAAADTIARRVAQPKPKMKLSPSDARAAAIALYEHRDRLRALHAVMPRSAVELARAIRERGVSIDEAERIAAYLVEVVRVLDFARLPTFDENHSHVTGRDWPEIDYTGEGMTWQSQKADWQPRGVADFRTVTSIHAYFVGAEKLPHWKKVYRPRGRMRDVKR